MKKDFIAVLDLFNEAELKSPLPHKAFNDIEAELKDLNLDKTSIYYCSPDFEGKPFSGFVRVDENKKPIFFEFKSKHYGSCNIRVMGKNINSDFVIDLDIINEYLRP
jgi:hypothetical protein